MQKNNKKTMKLNRKILSMIEKGEKVATTTEIAERLGISWNTAEKHLLELALEGRILRLKKAGVNLWMLK